MEYTKELEKEYRDWDNKRIKRQYRTLQLKEYTPEQIYHQVQNITEIILKQAEDYLVEYMNKEDQLDQSESEEGNNSASEEENNSDEEVENDSDGEICDSAIIDSSVEGSDIDESGSENEKLSEEVHKSIEGEEIDELIESTDVPSEKNSTEIQSDEELESFEYNYNSEELNDIYEYLEGGDDSAELLTETAEHTLRKLQK